MPVDPDKMFDDETRQNAARQLFDNDDAIDILAVDRAASDALLHILTPENVETDALQELMIERIADGGSESVGELAGDVIYELLEGESNSRQNALLRVMDGDYERGNAGPDLESLTSGIRGVSKTPTERARAETYDPDEAAERANSLTARRNGDIFDSELGHLIPGKRYDDD